MSTLIFQSLFMFQELRKGLDIKNYRLLQKLRCQGIIPVVPNENHAIAPWSPDSHFRTKKL